MTPEQIEMSRTTIAARDMETLLAMAANVLVEVTKVKTLRTAAKGRAYRDDTNAAWDLYNELDAHRNELGALHQTIQREIAARNKAAKDERREAFKTLEASRIARSTSWERAFVQVARKKLTGEQFEEIAKIAELEA